MRFVPFIALAAPVLAQYDAKPKPNKPEKPGKPHGPPPHGPPPHGPPAHANNQKLVTPKELIKKINLKDLLDGSQVLQNFADEAGGNRAFGSTGHNATAEWLYQTLLKTGYYDVYKQPFVELFTAATTNFEVGGEDIPVTYMTFGPSGNVEANIVKVNNLGCAVADFPAGVANNIALISRGTCPFADKAANAKTAGAAAALIYNNEPVNPLSGTLGGEGDYVPVAGITKEAGESLIAQIGNSTAVSGSLTIDAIRENRTNYNVIAETKGGDHDNVLMLGGHTDSVFAGPGINDDGSGTIGTLMTGLALTKFKVKNAVRLGFWGAEEYGKLGSFYYMKTINGSLGGSAAEVGKLRAYLNFDMIASPNYVLGIYDGDGSAFNFSGPTGSDKIEKDFEEFYEQRGLPHVPALFSLRSDYAAFLENGIPSGGLFTGAEVLKTEEEAQLFGGEAGVALDACYHQACDTIENLAHDAYLLNTQSIANSVAKYAVSFEGIPRANETLRKRGAERSRMMARMDDGGHHHHGQTCGTGKHAV